MTLKELKDFFENQPSGKLFQFGISRPFSWRGSYDEVAFSIEEYESTREDILNNINDAYIGTYTGYKGGDYNYSDDTTVNFEEDYSRWSDGSYTMNLLLKFLFN